MGVVDPDSYPAFVPLVRSIVRAAVTAPIKVASSLLVSVIAMQLAVFRRRRLI